MLKLLFVILISINLYADLGKIVNVVDGDTVDILKSNGSIFRARLAYIDTMESKRNAKLKKDVKKYKVIDYKLLHMGLLAKEYVIDNYLNKYVVYHIISKGRYHRAITYIENLNIELLKLGYAKIYNYKDKYSKEYLLKYENEAKSKHIGIWRYIK